LWNTDLYSVSFLLFTSGISGLLFCVIYFIVDQVWRCGCCGYGAVDMVLWVWCCGYGAVGAVGCGGVGVLGAWGVCMGWVGVWVHGVCGCMGCVWEWVRVGESIVHLMTSLYSLYTLYTIHDTLYSLYTLYTPYTIHYTLCSGRDHSMTLPAETPLSEGSSASGD
jgi:hypothetical protein